MLQHFQTNILKFWKFSHKNQKKIGNFHTKIKKKIGNFQTKLEIVNQKLEIFEKNQNVGNCFRKNSQITILENI